MTRFLRALVAALVLGGQASPLLAAVTCTSNVWTVQPGSFSNIGYSATFTDFCAERNATAVAAGYTAISCIVSGDGLNATQQFTVGAQVRVYTWLRSGTCSDDAALMGPYDANVGLYVFVVGAVGLFALGFIGGMKR